MAQSRMWQLIWPRQPDSSPLHMLLDGTRDTETLLRDAARLQPPQLPLDVLSQLRALEDAGQVAHVAKQNQARTQKGMVSPAVAAVGLLAAAAALPLAIQAHLLMCGHNDFGSPSQVLAFASVVIGFLMISRLTTRLVALRVGGGHAVGFSFTVSPPWFVKEHADGPPKARQQRIAALAGMVAPPVLVLLLWICTLVTIPPVHGLWTGDHVAGPLCADASAFHGFIPAFLLPFMFSLFWLDLAPYVPTGGATLLAVATGIPDLRRRSLAFLSRRVVRNLRSRLPLSELERSYLGVASLWLLHAVGSILLLAFWALPLTLKFASHSARRDLPRWQWALGALPAVLCLSLLLLLIWRLVAIGASFVRQSVVSQRADAPKQSADLAGAQVADFAKSAAAIPFLAALGETALEEIATQAKSESHAQGSIIIQQGCAGDRFCFIAKGTARVLVEEQSGLQHEVAVLQAGAFFGETALVEPVPRTATVVAESAVELVTLDRERFLTVVAAAGASGAQVRSQIRNAACLRSHPLFQGLGRDALRHLQESATETAVSDGAAVVTEGEAGDTLYVVRDGSFVVSRTVSGKTREIAVLGPGDWFGELALLGARPRSATVRARDPATALALPRAAVDAALASDLHAAAYLHEVCAERLAMLAAGGAA